jgi:hypothetical protein
VSFTSGSIAGGTPAAASYPTTAVNLTAIAAACGGKTLDLTIVDSGGLALASSGPIVLIGKPLATTVVSIAPTDAKLISGVSVVISG